MGGERGGRKEEPPKWKTSLIAGTSSADLENDAGRQRKDSVDANRHNTTTFIVITNKYANERKVGAPSKPRWRGWGSF